MAQPNRLIGEKSPYLLQHAYNPVDWRPWSEEAFQAARAEDKPIFLSIGYSTCHWCHVMERESFENQSIADLLNQSFISIKLDREERPDVDRVYMTFVQATTGSGGWPMSVFLTPDLKPFFGGTYFPPENAYGRPGFRYLLQYLANAWATEREKVLESGEDVVEQLRKQGVMNSGDSELATDQSLDSGFQMYRRTFDPKLGGFGQAPKFPRPSVYNFLLRHWKYSGNEDSLSMVLKTLTEMAAGGMYDQVGGGFHRYSVDERWFVPHFEKMLYDQAQLATSYLEAFQITRDERFAHVARDIFEYVRRDLRSPEGAFFSAEDADSVIDPAHPHEKGEGAFYVWTESEIEEVLGPDGGWFARAFGVRPNGNVDHDPHHEFTGKNILYQATEPKVEQSQVAAAREKLLTARSKRIRPGLDDKILTSWNGLMISAFALGSQVLADNGYLQIASKAADFILATLWDGSVLKRRFREGDAAIDGFLDDYAGFGIALLDLYEAGFEPRYLESATQIAVAMRRHFEDLENGAFFSSAEGDPSLILRMKEDYDGAEPSGNSLAAVFLLRLAAITGSDEYRKSAEATLKAFASRLRAAPVALPQMLVALLFWRSTPKQIVLAGDDVAPLLAEIRKRFLPNKVLLTPNPQSPQTAGMSAVDGKAAAYVCENFVCQLPVTTTAELGTLLDA